MSLPPLDAQRYLNFIGRLGNDTTRILHWLGNVNRIYRYRRCTPPRSPSWPESWACR